MPNFISVLYNQYRKKTRLLTFFRISQILKFLRNDNDIFEGSSTKFPLDKEPGYSIFLTCWSVILGDIPSQLYTPCQRETKYWSWFISSCGGIVVYSIFFKLCNFCLSYKLLVLNIKSVLRRKMQKLTHNVPLTQNVQCSINLVICNNLFPTRCNDAKQFLSVKLYNLLVTFSQAELKSYFALKELFTLIFQVWL